MDINSIVKLKIIKKIKSSITNDKVTIYNIKGRCPEKLRTLCTKGSYNDGYFICVDTNNYSCFYETDLNHESFGSLSFSSISDYSGIDFNDFLNKISDSANQDLIVTKNNLLYHLKNELSKIKLVSISDTKIDKVLIESIVNNVSNLERIEIRNSIIDSECDFNTNKDVIIYIIDSEIENFHSFKNTLGKIDFTRDRISDISFLEYSCSDLSFFKCDIDFNKLFLNTKFNNIETLVIDTNNTYDDNGNNCFADLGNSFFFLPYAMPNLVNLRIAARVDDLDFLEKLPFLNKLSLLSSVSMLDNHLLDINDKTKLDKLYNRYRDLIDISKKENYFYEKDAYHITEVYKKRILELADFFKTISFTSDCEDTLKSNFWHKKDILSYYLDPDFIKLDGYYELYYDKLRFFKLQNPNFYIDEKQLKCVQNIVFFEEKFISQRIVLAKPIIFYIDGRPIILSKPKYKKTNINVENISQSPSKYTCDDTNIYLEDIKDVAGTYSNTNTTVEDFENRRSCGPASEISLDLIYRDLLERVTGNKEVLFKLHKYNEKNKYFFHLRLVKKKLETLLYKMINIHFDEFNIPELFIISNKVGIEFDLDILSLFSDIDETEILESIDNKCNNKFLKMIDAINNINKLNNNISERETTLTNGDIQKIKRLSLKDNNNMVK